MSGLQRSFQAYNAAMPTTARASFVACSSTLKTMMQLKNTVGFIPIYWGYTLDAAPTAPVYVELLTTGTVAATGLTAYGAGDIIKYGDPSGAASVASLGTSTSGFTAATSEGTITATKILDVGDPQAIGYRTQLPLDRESGVVATDYLRIRAITTMTVNMLCWIGWLEQG